MKNLVITKIIIGYIIGIIIGNIILYIADYQIEQEPLLHKKDLVELENEKLKLEIELLKRKLGE